MIAHDWLIIGLAIVSLWVLWGMLNLIADLIDQHRQASAAASRRGLVNQQGEGTILSRGSSSLHRFLQFGRDRCSRSVTVGR